MTSSQKWAILAIYEVRTTSILHNLHKTEVIEQWYSYWKENQGSNWVDYAVWTGTEEEARQKVKMLNNYITNDYHIAVPYPF